MIRVSSNLIVRFSSHKGLVYFISIYIHLMMCKLSNVCSGSASHQLSATALLGSPDGSRHPLDVCEFTEEDYRHQNGNGSNGHYQNSRSGAGIWECLIGCRRRFDQQLARRRVSPTTYIYPLFLSLLGEIEMS